MITLFDLQKLYKNYFGTTPYYVTPSTLEKGEEGIFYTQKNIALNKMNPYNKAVWFPLDIRGRKKNGEEIQVETDACTFAVSLRKNIVKTSLSERKGTIKEIFTTEDYKFTVKGFLIGKNRKFPEEEIENLKALFESDEIVTMHGGYPEIFLDERCNVVVEHLEFPELQGSAPYIRPFSMTVLSDFEDNLE